MASYLVMKTPGPERGADSVRFVPDGFAWAALIFPLIWMLFHRMWLYALFYLVAAGIVGALAEAAGLETAGSVALFALNVLIALESGELRRRHLVSKGWSLDHILSAGSLSEAEEIYFSNVDQPVSAFYSTPAASASGLSRGANAPALGLFDAYKGR